MAASDPKQTLSYEALMLKKDKEYFINFTSDTPSKRSEAIEYFNSLENGHFEDHPPSRKLVKEYIKNLESIVISSSNPDEVDWAIQFCADVEYISPSMKPAIYKLLESGNCSFIPTILWCISRNPEHFIDCGNVFKRLTVNRDREVRWRLPYVILQMPEITDDMVETINMLQNDNDETTQLYIRQCQKSPKWPN